MDRGNRNQKERSRRQPAQDKNRETKFSHAALSSASTNLVASSMRSRAPGDITPNACLECRKKRAKARFSLHIEYFCG